MSYTKVSNLFNVITQKSEYFQSYWAGYRHNVNENVVNNFNVEGNVGRLYPAVNWATPFGSSENVSNDSNLKEDIKVSLYFDNLQGRDNCGNQTDLTLNEQIDELKEQAFIFLDTFKELCFNKYCLGATNSNIVNIDINSDAHNDSLLVVRLDFEFTMFLDSCLEVDASIYPDELPECDLENYCSCALAPEVQLPTDAMIINLDPAIGVNSGNPVDGESMFLIADQSGESNDYVQSSSGALQPSWAQNAINGLPGINFDTASFLSTSGVMLMDEISIFIAIKNQGAPHAGYGCPFIFGPASFVSAGSFMQMNTIGGTYNLNMQNDLLDQVLTTATNDAFVFGIVKTPAQVEYFVNGVSIGVNLGGQSINGTTHYLGGWANNFTNCLIGQMTVYGKALDSAETTQATNFYMNKFIP